MNLPIKLKMTVVVAACALALAAHAQHPKTVEKETAAETDTLSVVLPSGPGSRLILTPCTGCTPMLLSAVQSTAYQLRGQRVTLSEFRAAIAGKKANMIVVFDTKTHELRRVKADVAANAAANAS